MGGFFYRASPYSSAVTIQNAVIATGDYTLDNSDFAILADASSNPVTISLPPDPTHGKMFSIKAIDSTFVVTIDRNGKLIDGGANNINLVATDSSWLQYDSTYGWAFI